MLFSSIPFLYYFLPVVLVLYFIVPDKLKNFVLLTSSLFFYGWGESKYVFLMLAIIACGYVLGILIEKYRNQKAGKLFLTLSVVIDIAVLGYFKYADFFVENFNSNPEKLKVYFSPHALNYQIFKFDNKLLSEAAKEQLMDAGVLLENIVDYKIDTVDNINLPSHSSGDRTQRFAIAVKQN